MNSNFSALTFSDSDYSVSAGNFVSPSLQRSAPLSRTCTFNCFCCARINLGLFCACNSSKMTVSTQTYSFDFPKDHQQDPQNMWKRGTFEHGTVQKLINTTIEKYMPFTVKNTMTMDTAFEEIFIRLGVQFPNYAIDRKKLRSRMLKSMEWQRYYSKKREQAKKEDRSAHQILRKKRKHADVNKENEPLLPTENADMGVDNPAFQSDDDSDSDVPLAMLQRGNGLKLLVVAIDSEMREVSDSSTPVASGQNLEGRSRFAKLGMATNDVLNKACRDILESEIPASDIENKVNLLSNKERKNMKLYTHQEDILKKANNSGYEEFDISLTYKCIRNICSTIPMPTKGKWGDDSMPAAGKVTVGDDIERIRLIRNELTAHVSSASTPQKEFDDTWSMMSDICRRLETFTGKKYLDDLKFH
ncbi:uncharacterized protein LOC134273910 [Saccostrea cucullata]|uniref:uncharacterized protein LOC134273910 n=1 Tax=Saccostrea cuccullata TaxID=36930 RepID=UPI002ED1F587